MIKKSPKTIENPFISVGFWAVYLTAVSLYIAAVLSGYYINGIFFYVALFCLTPYALLGIAAWAALKNKNKPVALGLMLGGLTPFITAFVAIAGYDLLTWV